MRFLRFYKKLFNVDIGCKLSLSSEFFNKGVALKILNQSDTFAT